MNARSGSEADERHRLDKWLWHTRFFKTRSLATAAVNGGRIKVNGERIKPAHAVRIGERLAVSIGEHSIEIDVLALPARRGTAQDARACYAETADSATRTVRYQEQRKLAALTHPRPDARPDKRERRQLDRLRRQQG